MPRERRREWTSYNPWKNRERLTGTKQHKPSLVFRKPTLERVAENHDVSIQETPIDTFAEQEEYIIRLSPLAFPLTQMFAEREILAEQYTNWENVHIGGVLFPSDDDVTADPVMQEIAYELMNLVKLVRMNIGGGCVLDDGTAYPTALELITVGMAHSRGLVGIDPLAPDDWIFIIVHVLPSSDSALLDSTYGNDISHSDSYSGSLKVFGGKVVRDVPKPFFSMTYNGNPIGDLTSDEISSVDGNYFHTFIPIPQISGGTPPPGYTYIDVPPNCCNGGAQPPNVPPTTPPTIDPTLPTPPTPVGVTTADIACSEIFAQSGESFDFWSDLASFGAKVYGNRPSFGSQYPVALGGPIHTWIHDNVPEFDFGCDRLLSVTMLLHMTHTDPRIFGVITNPFGSNNVTPRIDNYKPLGGTTFQHDPIYFFQPDSTTQSFIGPVDIIVNRYSKFLYESSHKITVRDQDRYEGHIGTEDWFYYVDESDVVDAASVDPMSLQVCGIQYKAHQYIDFFAFDGSDEVQTIAGTNYIYGKYGNARIAIGSGYFVTDGFDVFTDGLHPGNIAVDWICALKIPGTSGVATGQVTQVDYPGEVGDRIHLYVPGVVDPTISNYVDIAHDAVKAGFGCVLSTTFPAIGPYTFNIGNDGSHHMKFYNVTVYIS